MWRNFQLKTFSVIWFIKYIESVLFLSNEKIRRGNHKKNIYEWLRGSLMPVHSACHSASAWTFFCKCENLQNILFSYDIQMNMNMGELKPNEFFLPLTSKHWSVFRETGTYLSKNDLSHGLILFRNKKIISFHWFLLFSQYLGNFANSS